MNGEPSLKAFLIFFGILVVEDQPVRQVAKVHEGPPAANNDFGLDSSTADKAGSPEQTMIERRLAEAASNRPPPKALDPTLLASSTLFKVKQANSGITKHVEKLWATGVESGGGDGKLFSVQRLI